MKRTGKPPRALTAADVMRRAPAALHHRATMRYAARVIGRRRPHVIPVTDDRGRLVGVLSAADLLRWWAGGGTGDEEPAWTDWQLMPPEAGRTDEVRWQLNRHPVAVPPGAGLADVARRMRAARACCAVVIDEASRPVGVITSADLLAADGSLAPLAAEQDFPDALFAGRRPARRMALTRPVG
jgi:CBS domain-containing protein